MQIERVLHGARADRGSIVGEVNLPRKPIVFFRQWSSLQTLFACAVTYFACVRKIYLTTLVSYGSAP